MIYFIPHQLNPQCFLESTSFNPNDVVIRGGSESPGALSFTVSTGTEREREPGPSACQPHRPSGHEVGAAGSLARKPQDMSRSIDG